MPSHVARPTSIPNQQEHDMRNYIKAAGFTGILAVALAATAPEAEVDPVWWSPSGAHGPLQAR